MYKNLFKKNNEYFVSFQTYEDRNYAQDMAKEIEGYVKTVYEPDFDINCKVCCESKAIMLPHHYPSKNCESGRRFHCTCDVCY